MTRTSNVAIVPRINGIRAIPPPGLSRSCMNVILLERVVNKWYGVSIAECYAYCRLFCVCDEKGLWRLAPFYYRPSVIHPKLSARLVTENRESLRPTVKIAQSKKQKRK